MFEWLRASQVRQLPVSAIVLSPPLQRLATLAELEPLIAQHSPVQ
jgi:phospholipid transport system transporter-binding protein